MSNISIPFISLQVESLSDNQRMVKFIEFLISTDTESAYEKLCSVLIKDYNWISRDLEIDLRIEKGDLELDDDVIKEAAMLVHKKFGTSKRLSEGDKKEMKELMALKIQMSKAEWKKELDQVHEQLRQQSDLNHLKDTKAQSLNTTVRYYLRDHDAQLASHAHEMTTTSDIIAKSNVQSSESSDERLDGLKFHLETLFNKVTRCLANRDLILREREKCLKILGVKDEKESLDVVIKDQLENLPKQLKACQDELAKKNKSIQRQNGTMSDLEDELQKKDELIKSLQTQLSEKTDRLVALEESISTLQKQNSEMLSPKSQPIEKVKKKTAVNGTKASAKKK